MSRPRVLIADPVDREALALGAGFEVDYLPGMTRSDLEATISEYQVLVVRSRTRVDARLLAEGTNLEVIARPGTGLDNIDVEAATARGIRVLNSPESLVEAVAEHTLGLMLALARRTTSADAATRAGRWEKEKLIGVELHGLALGIVGLGRVGRRVGELARAFGMTLLAHDITAPDRELLSRLDCRLVDLDLLLSSSDFVSLHVPLSKATAKLIDARRLSIMKKTAFLVNTSRGAVVDEAALASALRQEKIAGAALDVFEREPPGPLVLGAPNLIATPHVGGQTAQAQRKAASAVGAKIRKHFE